MLMYNNYRIIMMSGADMNDIKKQYKETANMIGVTLLMWVILFLMLTNTGPLIKMFIPRGLGSVYAEVILSVAYDVAYLLSFMLPAVLFFYLSKGKGAEPMRLGVRLSGDTFAIISAAVACVFTFSYLNAIFMSFFNIPSPPPVFNEAPSYMHNYSIVLQFITMALVPAFCEEFLFRGVILSNLMPYGKAVAIVGSSVLFGLMHGNFYQFLYTTAAGIILGAVYVLTDSIWCSTLVHLINNSISIIQTAVSERFNEYTASVILTVLEGVIFVFGLLSLIFLIVKRGKKTEKANKELKSVFGAQLDGENDALVGISRELSVTEAFKLFWCPSIIMFAVYSIINAILRFF